MKMPGPRTAGVCRFDVTMTMDNGVLAASRSVASQPHPRLASSAAIRNPAAAPPAPTRNTVE